MSAEVEANPEEAVKKPMIKIKKNLRSHIELGLWLVKVFELIICIVSISLAYEPIQNVVLCKTHTHHVGIMYTAITGFMVINGVILLGRIIGERIPYRIASLFAIMGAALFLITGILLTIDRPLLKQQYYPPEGHLLIMITIAIILIFLNSLLFAADAVFNFVVYMS